jgi:hypothetical protein
LLNYMVTEAGQGALFCRGEMAPVVLCDQWQAFGVTITSAAPPSISAQADSGMYGISI